MEKNMLTHGLASQSLADLNMLKDCTDRCPEKEWNERHKDYPFSQVVFHTLDVRKNMTKLERYVNLIRHLQQHTARLGLRLQFATVKEMVWISRGYDT